MAGNQSGGKFVTLEKQPVRPRSQRRHEVQAAQNLRQKRPSTTTFDQTRKHFGWFWDGVADQIRLLMMLMVLVEVVHIVMEK